MSARHSPVVRRRRLALELRRLRESSGRTLEEVAEYMECSVAKVSRIETGRVSARIQDVRDMLDMYHVAGDEREALLSLVREARQKAWWHAFGDVIPEGTEIFYGLENEASSIWSYETHVVPGLLQTPRYARALLESLPDAAPEDVERRLELRARRQALVDRADPPHLWVVLDEAVLRVAVGGTDIMGEQLRWLAVLAERETVTLQVVPFAAGEHAARGMPFVVFGFANPADPKVAYLEHLIPSSIMVVERAEEVGCYVAAFDNIRGHALNPRESRALLDRILGETRV